MCKELVKELKTLCSTAVNSVLCDCGPEKLMSFTWVEFEDELKQHAPLLFSTLMSLTKTKRVRANRSAVLCICAAILLKYRFPKMSAIHKIISCILYNGHCSKQVSKNKTSLINFMIKLLYNYIHVGLFQTVLPWSVYVLQWYPKDAKFFDMLL